MRGICVAVGTVMAAGVAACVLLTPRSPEPEVVVTSLCDARGGRTIIESYGPSAPSRTTVVVDHECDELRV